jgi:hypothetical protein
MSDGWGRIDPATVQTQRQWVVRIGTVSFLVWANSPEGAELSARTDCFDRKTTLDYLKKQRIYRTGPAHVHAATVDDIGIFETRGAVDA